MGTARHSGDDRRRHTRRRPFSDWSHVFVESRLSAARSAKALAGNRDEPDLVRRRKERGARTDIRNARPRVRALAAGRSPWADDRRRRADRRFEVPYAEPHDRALDAVPVLTTQAP